MFWATLTPGEDEQAAPTMGHDACVKVLQQLAKQCPKRGDTRGLGA